jgi:sugar phosphate isomerase/epimerase
MLQELVDTANAYKLTLHSTFTGLVAYSANLLLHPNRSKRNSARRWFGRVIRYSAQIGANATGGHIGAFSVEDWRNPERRRVIWAHLRASLAVLASDARQAGLHYLLIENLAAAREPSTIAMVQELLTEGDDNHVPIRLCLDVGHMCVPGTDAVDRDPYAWLHQLGPVAPVIHIQQSDSEADHHWPFTTERNRQGRIDADQVIDALGEGGVEQSVLILEVIPPMSDAHYYPANKATLVSSLYSTLAVSPAKNSIFSGPSTPNLRSTAATLRVISSDPLLPSPQYPR